MMRIGTSLLMSMKSQVVGSSLVSEYKSPGWHFWWNEDILHSWKFCLSNEKSKEGHTHALRWMKMIPEYKYEEHLRYYFKDPGWCRCPNHHYKILTCSHRHIAFCRYLLHINWLMCFFKRNWRSTVLLFSKLFQISWKML